MKVGSNRFLLERERHLSVYGSGLKQFPISHLCYVPPCDSFLFQIQSLRICECVETICALKLSGWIEQLPIVRNWFMLFSKNFSSSLGKFGVLGAKWGSFLNVCISSQKTKNEIPVACKTSFAVFFSYFRIYGHKNGRKLGKWERALSWPRAPHRSKAPKWGFPSGFPSTEFTSAYGSVFSQPISMTVERRDWKWFFATNVVF